MMQMTASEWYLDQQYFILFECGGVVSKGMDVLDYLQLECKIFMCRDSRKSEYARNELYHFVGDRLRPVCGRY